MGKRRAQRCWMWAIGQMPLWSNAQTFLLYATVTASQDFVATLLPKLRNAICQ